ncbi:CerR family C-terminal domain-containing protein [Salidesulfovibrio onnuriiensis]|uniref:CerR family C-terminal domain-containing protein n=1 Tax=Salidesulfovibrio onnuriiensis TaxID=2583823 RepID=UPI0011C7E74C|nr:CerR family C-terminal domain-containing protein [Salidesulfovibrio onnuriiensis]
MAATKKAKREYSPEQTRERLLLSGLKLFGRYGYKGVTTRALAEDAKVNQASIPYHFGGKEGLYRAVAEMVADDMTVVKSVFYRHAPLIFRKIGGRKALLRKVVQKSVRRIVRRFLGFRDNAADRPAFIVREYMEPGAGFDILYDRVIKNVHMALTAMVAAAFGLSEESDEAKLRAHALMGQVIAFGVARPVVLRRMGWESYTEENVDAIAGAVVEMVLGALGLKEREGNR